MTIKSARAFTLLATVFVAAVLLVCPATAQTARQLPSETPAKFTPTNDGFDHVRRNVMIPMRDGVKLHTVILVPKGARNAPILLTRTPYDATALTTHAQSSRLGPILSGYDNATDVIVEGGYI
ncbi:MAG TPA: CocE/NonD family hydrolase, partial [Blastocatellia bacterium]|nr:CocE/NonD family hydrolase [Blastocatellia bacterium]